MKADSEAVKQKADGSRHQTPEPPCEKIMDSNSLEESSSVTGQQDLVVTDKPSITDSPQENLFPATLETPGDNMGKCNPTVSPETLCRVEESNSPVSTEAIMTDK